MKVSYRCSRSNLSSGAAFVTFSASERPYSDFCKIFFKKTLSVSSVACALVILEENLLLNVLVEIRFSGLTERRHV